MLSEVLKWKSLSQTEFNEAYFAAVGHYKSRGIDIESTERTKVCAALAYEKDASICDLGSYINIYPVVLKLLGMTVTTVDLYPQKVPDSCDYNPSIIRALDLYRELDIHVIEMDLYQVELQASYYDVISCYETFEHLWHSPRPIMEKVGRALRGGGVFIISVPNIVNIANRIKVLIGRSPLPAFEDYYRHGNPFWGHRREMTIGEVDWMMKQAGLSKVKVFTANLYPPLGDNSSLQGRIYRSLTDRVPVFPSMRGTIFAVYRKKVV